MAYQFTTQTKASSGGTLKDIQPPQPTITVNPGTASKLVFTSSALSFVATSSPTAGPITVQSQDSFGNPSNPASTETVALSSNSPDNPKFSLSSGGSLVSSVSIPSSANSVSFFYGDTKAGTPTITASGTGAFSSAPAQQETVTPGALDHFGWNYISDQTAGFPFSSTTTAYDLFGNVKTDYNNSATLSSNLSSSDQGCGKDGA